VGIAQVGGKCLIVRRQLAQHVARRTKFALLSLTRCMPAICPMDRNVVPPISRTRSPSAGRHARPVS
jgi:hypothetical protein